jgi:hydroxymethylglutaryl-CoA synthase
VINLKKLRSVGIIGWGGYVPKFRISVEEIAKAWGKDGKKISQSLGVREKAVANSDEDAVTMAVEAAKIALMRAGIEPQKIGAVFVGSESHPYAVKPSATVVGEALGIGHDYLTADLEFACKAGTAGMQVVAGFLESKIIDYGLVVGTDKAQSKKGGVLEYAAASGAAAFILGRKRKEFLVQLESFISYTSDTPDFWRRSGQIHPSHGGRFTGEVAYFHHVIQSTRNFLERSARKISDYDYVIFHMPNKKFPERAAKRLGVVKGQLEPSLIVERIGNPYSASSLLGLCRVLEKAKANQSILLTSYGSGAGADTLSFKTTNRLLKKQRGITLDDFIREKEAINYLEYLKKAGEL